MLLLYFISGPDHYLPREQHMEQSDAHHPVRSRGDVGQGLDVVDPPTSSWIPRSLTSLSESGKNNNLPLK